mgnify:CR=1 FL=1
MKEVTGVIQRRAKKRDESANIFLQVYNNGNEMWYGLSAKLVVSIVGKYLKEQRFPKRFPKPRSVIGYVSPSD